ncbi:lysylphosphatidylglycerol synthase domain-containing protein [Micromonospora sp. NPDC126480]|uniref:lysylphosphatidylglycerol synthase domain-containing protein n=1 Tax=Micromonospora sp. NPDC126480 TaxID=3155312 RepID=UPI00332C88D3
MTRDRLRRLLGPLVVVAALVGLALVLRRDGAEAARTLLRAETAPLLAAAVSANLAGLLLGRYAWQVLLAGRMTGPTAARVFFLGQLGKYLPGRVWGVLTHIELGRAAGVPGARMASAYLVSLALTLLTGAGVGLLAAPAALGGRPAWWLAAPLLLLLACTAVPALVTAPVAAASRRLRRPVRPPAPRLVRYALGLATLSWLVSGLHLWALVVALGAPPLAAAAPAVGAFALATVAGSLALLVPDGWGVREVTILAALAAVLPLGPAGAAAVASRVVCVLVEITTSLVVLAWARIRTSVPSTEPTGEPNAPEPAHP